MAEYVNAFVDGDEVVLLRREGDRVVEHREPSQHVSYHVVADVPHELGRALRSSANVLSVRGEGRYARIQWKRPFRQGHGDWVVDPRRRMMSDPESPFVARGLQTYEGDVDPVLRRMVDTGDAVQRPRRCYFDLETDSSVPFSRKEDMRVFCWVVLDDSAAEWVAARKLTREQVAEAIADGSLPAESMVLREDTDAAEKELLEALWAALLRYDQACAWNGHGFDEPVLVARTERCGLCVDPRRILFCDQLMVFKRANVTASESGDEKTSMRLQDVSTSLGLEGKDAFDASRTRQCYDQGDGSRMPPEAPCAGCGKHHEHSARICMQRYCIKDGLLLPQIEARTGYMDLFFTLCEACGIFPDSLGTNPSQQVDSFMLRLGKRKGIHFRTRQRLEAPEQFKGAYVMEPTLKGVVRDVHVCDYRRLYPSIMITGNMSPETRVGIYSPESRMVALAAGGTSPMRPEWFRTPRTNIVFDTSVKGILVEALEELIRLRDYWTKEKAKCAPGSPEWVEADRRSTAYKQATNAFYGVVSSIVARYYDPLVGESTTQMGVELLMLVIAEVAKRGWEAIYGDTDSLFVRGCTDDEFVAFVAYLNAEVFPKFVADCGAKVNDIHLAYEKKFSHLVLVGKKRYIARFAHYKGSPPKITSRPEIKGLEFKRGDTARLARKFQESVVRLLMGDWECPTCRGQHYKGKDDCPTPGLHAAPCLDPQVFHAAVAREQEAILRGTLLPADFVISKTITKRLPPPPGEVDEHVARLRERALAKGQSLDADEEAAIRATYLAKRAGEEGYKTRVKDDGTPYAHPPHVQVAIILKARGMEVDGSKVGYVVTDGSTSPMRVIPAVDADESSVDRYYLWENLVWPPTERLLQAAFPDQDWGRWGRVRPKKPRKAPVRRAKAEVQTVLLDPETSEETVLTAGDVERMRASLAADGIGATACQTRLRTRADVAAFEGIVRAAAKVLDDGAAGEVAAVRAGIDEKVAEFKERGLIATTAPTSDGTLRIYAPGGVVEVPVRTGGSVATISGRMRQALGIDAHPAWKWVGGKRQLADEILARLPEKIEGTYYEPFAGAGAIFFALFAAGRIERAVLTDTNGEVVDAYVSIRDDLDALVEALRRHVNEKDHYLAQRALDPARLSRVERAARFLFLNRCGFNGLYRVNRAGEFNVPFGDMKNPTICDEANLRACSRALKIAKVGRCDYRVPLSKAGSGDAVYADPPYWPASATANFTSYQAGGFGPEEQVNLRVAAREAAARGARVLLSNSDVPEVRALYERGFLVERVEATRRVNRDASKRGPVGELLISSLGPDPGAPRRGRGNLVDNVPGA